SAYTRPAIHDDDFGIGTFGLGPLTTWARAKGTRSGDATPGDDLGMLLRALAVPTAVAGVRYPRGVRIRRVRVPASPGGERREQAGAWGGGGWGVPPQSGCTPWWRAAPRPARWPTK